MSISEFLSFTLRKTQAADPKTLCTDLDNVIPGWSAGIQADMDVSERILANLDSGNPCRNDGDLTSLSAVSVSS
jgi:hypothetical protein